MTQLKTPGVLTQASQNVTAPSFPSQPPPAATQAANLKIDADGMIVDAKVKSARSIGLEHGAMKAIHGIIVHQTNAPTAKSTLDSYKLAGANGAHLLIDKDGTIYQTASLYKRTRHVGALKARCLVENRCTPVELKAYSKFDPKGMHKSESAKSVPDRYPSNDDSIGIELVGKSSPSPKDPKLFIYEVVTDEQNKSLAWLTQMLSSALGVSMNEVFRHPDVSRKQPSEASTAKW
jgi:N-acetyl-anhydromuramyl-L-alanine amidase AmpD